MRHAIVLLAAVLAAAAETSPLVGKWTLDKSRSQLSGRMAVNQAVIDESMTIVLDGATMTTVSVTTGGPLGDVRRTETYVVDGKPHDFVPTSRVDSGTGRGT